MPRSRNANRNLLLVSLAAAALVTVTVLPNASAQQGRLIPPGPFESSKQYPVTFEVLSSVPEGVDLGPYLNSLFSSVRRNFIAKFSESPASGGKGVVVVRVHLKKRSGAWAEKFVRIVSRSGMEDMDEAAASAILAADPFARFPEAYPDSSLDLLFTFYYKRIPEQPEQKPKFVPVGT